MFFTPKIFVNICNIRCNNARSVEGPFGNATVLDKVFSNYLSACVINYKLIVQEFLQNMEVQILAGNY